MLVLPFSPGDRGAAVLAHQMFVGALSQLVLVLGSVAGPDFSCKATRNDEFECAVDAMVRDLQIFSFRQISG